MQNGVVLVIDEGELDHAADIQETTREDFIFSDDGQHERGFGLALALLLEEVVSVAFFAREDEVKQLVAVVGDHLGDEEVMQNVGALLVGEKGVGADLEQMLCEITVAEFDGEHEEGLVVLGLAGVMGGAGAGERVRGKAYMRSSERVSV